VFLGWENGGLRFSGLLCLCESECTGSSPHDDRQHVRSVFLRNYSGEMHERHEDEWYSVLRQAEHKSPARRKAFQ
jgi:hypothetical protein